jgi:hypothetical protein
MVVCEWFSSQNLYNILRAGAFTLVECLAEAGPSYARWSYVECRETDRSIRNKHNKSHPSPSPDRIIVPTNDKLT